MAKADKVTAFRLPSEALELVEGVARRRSVSVNELARELMLTVATEAILITAGKVSLEDAETFAREKLRKGRGTLETTI